MYIVLLIVSVLLLTLLLLLVTIGISFDIKNIRQHNKRHREFTKQNNELRNLLPSFKNEEEEFINELGGKYGREIYFFKEMETIIKLQDAERKIMSRKINTLYFCKKCGKSFAYRSNITNHKITYLHFNKENLNKKYEQNRKKSN